MPIRDVAAMNRSLDNDYGTTRGPNAAASHQLALFDGDPMLDPIDGGGTELSAVDNPGYARVTINPADWAAAVNGMKELTAPKEFPDPTAQWLSSATHWALIETGEIFWDVGPLTDALEISGASTTGPLVNIAVFYEDAVVNDEEF